MIFFFTSGVAKDPSSILNTNRKVVLRQLVKCVSGAIHSFVNYIGIRGSILILSGIVLTYSTEETRGGVITSASSIQYSLFHCLRFHLLIAIVTPNSYISFQDLHNLHSWFQYVSLYSSQCWNRIDLFTEWISCILLNHMRLQQIKILFNLLLTKAILYSTALLLCQQHFSTHCYTYLFSQRAHSHLFQLLFNMMHGSKRWFPYSAHEQIGVF